MSNIYTENGFKDRADFVRYVEDLAAEYPFDKKDVVELAMALGPSEARDGLVITLDDKLEQLEC